MKKVLRVPPYYSVGESEFAVAVSAVAAIVGSLIGGFFVPRRKPVWAALLIAVLIATFLWHWLYLHETAGVFYWELICRALFFLCLGVFGVSLGKEKAGGGGGDEVT